jgi:hypothetical protein
MSLTPLIPAKAGIQLRLKRAACCLAKTGSPHLRAERLSQSNLITLLFQHRGQALRHGWPLTRKRGRGPPERIAPSYRAAGLPDQSIRLLSRLLRVNSCLDATLTRCWRSSAFGTQRRLMHCNDMSVVRRRTEVSVRLSERRV